MIEPNNSLAIDCPSRQNLEAFVLGQMPVTEIDALGKHIVECSRCESLLDTLHKNRKTVFSPLRQAARRTSGTLGELLAEPEYQEFAAHVCGLRFAGAIEVESTKQFVPGPSGDSPPIQIAHYLISREIGRGGFATVYLGHDPHHRRQVAVKILRRDRFAPARVREGFLSESRIVATLQHPSIVPVLDWGMTDEFGPYVVMEFIDGQTLAEAMAARQLDRQKLVEIVTDVAQALHHAHKLGLVHRDVKPQNILLDADTRPFVADFGLAIRDEEQWNHRGELAGTRSYMAPEQVRRESHRLDGRTDLWALGVILFQALTNRQPFGGKSPEQLDDEIQHREPKPPRQIDDTIPEDLERICLKCLSKKMTDRYSTALDLAKDLQQAMHPRPPAVPAIPSGSTTVIPRGIRSFGPEDQHFFLDLLPGPRDATGIPDSMRSWKARLEFADPATDASIAVLYGPSGCGKSSFVRAGLLPRLESHVVHAYVDAGGQNFEQRLLKALKHACRDIPPQATLIETIARLRTGRHFPAGCTKCVIVLDQFEQWLHRNREVVDAPLVQALRQCDGEHVQCLILVRDDFWMAVSRFMSALEIPLREGKNCAAVDLFDARHAQRVLTLFGRAQGNLPASPAALNAEQEAFLQSAVEDLDFNGRVVCVRLALFAEMVKAKPWTPRTLTQLGGAKGVGVTFLEESFGRSAPARHRLVSNSIRAILAALLPDDLTEIRAQAQSRERLLAVSGCSPRTNFDEILGILDLELRLITPVDVEPVDESPAGSNSDSPPSGQYYQLTHDYLVPSIRDWLNRKQRETLRGRAELLLDERARLWNATGDRKQLPSLLEWIRIRCLTRQRDWNPRERQLIQVTSRYHGARMAIGFATMSVMFGIAIAAYGHVRGAWLIDNLQTAETANIETVVRQIQNNSYWTRGKLRGQPRPADPAQQFRFDVASFALGDPVDLMPATLRATPKEMQLILNVLKLRPADPDFSQRLWYVMKDDTESGNARFRAACVLASVDADNEDWTPLIAGVADLFLMQEQHLADEWLELLRPIGQRLIVPLEVRFLQDPPHDSLTRSLATLALAEFCEKDQAKLISLLKSSATEQDVFLRKLEHDRPTAIMRIESDFLSTDKLSQNPSDREREVIQKARLGTALILLGKPDNVWLQLENQPDPSLRFELINQFAAWRVDPKTLWNQLKETASPGIRYALILALGEYPPTDTLAKLGTDAPAFLLHLSQEDPDPGVHSATDWLLRNWNLPRGNLAPPPGPPVPKKNWLVDKEGHTMVAISTPGAFLMGSPVDETDRRDDESQHARRIDYKYAMSSKPVTVAQFRRSGCIDSSSPTNDVNCPIDRVEIAEAIRYCNWLSMRNDIPFDQWCYELRQDGNTPYLHPVEGFLSKAGYRLPTEAEWEYACRAGTTTQRFCGNSRSNLQKYAWFKDNSDGHLHIAGELRPNPYGLCDLYGNASQWCQNEYGVYPLENARDSFTVSRSSIFSFRGCTYESRHSVARSARRGSTLTVALTALGFRVARSIK